MTDDDEEQQEQRAHADHHAEGVEVDRNVRHQFGSVLDIPIAEVRHVLLQLRSQFFQFGIVGILGPQRSVFRQ